MRKRNCFRSCLSEMEIEFKLQLAMKFRRQGNSLHFNGWTYRRNCFFSFYFTFLRISQHNARFLVSLFGHWYVDDWLCRAMPTHFSVSNWNGRFVFFFLLPNWAERKQKDKICFWCAQTRKTVKHEFLWVPNAPKLLNCWNCSTASVIQSWRDVEWIWREHKNAFTYFRLMRGESLTVCVLPADLDNDTRTLSTVKAREFGSFRFCYWLPRIE